MEDGDTPFLEVKDASSGGIDAQTAEILSRVDTFSVQQRVSMMEAGTCGCCEAANQYDIFDETNGTRLMLAEERSSLLTRICCAPGHTLLVDVHAVDPRGNKLYQVMTVERLGCCCKKPCLGCCACCEPCADGATMYAGAVEGEAGSLSPHSRIGAVRQPTMFGGAACKPSIKLVDRSETDIGTIEGPQCFGGCSELCCDTSFKLDGGRAVITKQKPHSLSDAMRELGTDADMFRLHFKDPSADATTKANMLGAMLLLDLMFFENVRAWRGGPRACAVRAARPRACEPRAAVPPARLPTPPPPPRTRHYNAGGTQYTADVRRIWTCANGRAAAR